MNLYIPQTRTCICFLGRGTAATAGENSSDPAFSLGCNDLAPEFPRVTFLLMKMREPHILTTAKHSTNPSSEGFLLGAWRAHAALATLLPRSAQRACYRIQG